MITLQKLKVEDVYHLDESKPLILKTTDEFSDVIKNFAHHTELRGMFVVDDENRLLGVITRTDMLDWARAQLGQIRLKPLKDLDKTIRIITLIQATTVGDIMRPETKQAAVRRGETLAQALRVMVDTDLIVLPVVDEEQRIIGRLRLTDLLLRSLE